MDRDLWGDPRGRAKYSEQSTYFGVRWAVIQIPWHHLLLAGVSLNFSMSLCNNRGEILTLRVMERGTLAVYDMQEMLPGTK